jgi:hypothetical protein
VERYPPIEPFAHGLLDVGDGTSRSIGAGGASLGPERAAGSFTVRQLKGPVGNTIGIAAHPPGYPGSGSPE